MSRVLNEGFAEVFKKVRYLPRRLAVGQKLSEKLRIKCRCLNCFSGHWCDLPSEMKVNNNSGHLHEVFYILIQSPGRIFGTHRRANVGKGGIMREFSEKRAKVIKVTHYF